MINGKKDSDVEMNSGDVCSCCLLQKTLSGDAGTYVLHTTTNSEAKYALALSSNILKVYGDGKSPTVLSGHNKSITDIKFSKKDSNLLFSSSLDCNIHVWDVRSNKIVQSFSDSSDDLMKPITSFDLNLDEQLICAGTELLREDSYILFWDRRSSKCLGGYWNSHTDDITQVQFHPSFAAGLATSSVDGLINIFDLNESCEDDALTQTLNVETSVNKFSWHENDILSCITGIEEYKLWHISEANLLASVSKEDFTEQYQVNVDYLIDTLKISNSWFLATGLYNGLVQLWHIEESGLKLASTLEGHSDIVRSICYNSKEDTIITGGEDGLFCLWKPSES